MPLPIYNEKNASTIHYQNKNKIGQVIAVAAGKGGVGKSTVSVGLARALKLAGYRVGLLDADLYGPSLRHMLKEESPPSMKESKILPAVCEGIMLMSMAYFRQASEAAAVRAPIANGAIKQFLLDTEWGQLDYLIIDFPPGTGDIQITLGQSANLSGALLVTTPQEVACLDVRKAANLFNQLGVPLIGMVENYSFYKASKNAEPQYIFGKGGGERLAKELGIPLIAKIPLDPCISQCGDRGESFFEKEASSEIGDIFKNLSKAVEDQLKDIKTRTLQNLASFDIEWKPMENRVYSNHQVNPEEVNNKLEHTIAVSKIEQVSACAFQIVWSDGKNKVYQLEDLQRVCPCANCTDESNGKRRSGLADPSKELSAKRIYSVGRYALRVDFINGCKAGIFDFPLLYNLSTMSQ